METTTFIEERKTTTEPKHLSIETKVCATVIDMEDGLLKKIMINDDVFINIRFKEKPTIEIIPDEIPDDKTVKKLVSLGKKIGYERYNIYENPLKDVMKLLTDGGRYTRNEISNKIFVKYYDYKFTSSYCNIASNYIAYLRNKRLINEAFKVKNNGKNSVNVKSYWIENKVIIEKAHPRDRIVFSDGTLPLISPNTKDAKNME